MLTKKGNSTGVLLVLDASGSMADKRDETIWEFNKYINKLKEDGNNYFLTVTTFNNKVKRLINDKAIKNVGDLERSEYDPEGWTALNDAICETLDKAMDYTHNICVVITDGQENSSTKFTNRDVRNKIGHLRDHHNWEFVFLGSGPDAWHVGQQYGFRYSVAADYNNPLNVKNMYSSALAATQTASSGAALNVQMFNTSSTGAKENDL